MLCAAFRLSQTATAVADIRNARRRPERHRVSPRPRASLRASSTDQRQASHRHRHDGQGEHHATRQYGHDHAHHDRRQPPPASDRRHDGGDKSNAKAYFAFGQRGHGHGFAGQVFGRCRPLCCGACNRGRAAPYVFFERRPDVPPIPADFGCWLRSRDGHGDGVHSRHRTCDRKGSKRFGNSTLCVPRWIVDNEVGSERRRSENGMVRRRGQVSIVVARSQLGRGWGGVLGWRV